MKFAQTAEKIGQLFGSSTRAAAVCSVVALGAWSSTALATPTLSSAANIVVPATTAGIYINVVTGVSGTAAATPGWDINPWSSSSLAFFNTSGASAITGGSYVGGTSVTTLLPGATIGGTSTWATSPTTAVTFGAAAGNWALNSTNYFGFRFIGEDAALHYGYGTIIIGATAGVRSVGEIWYESAANTGITISAVPEPSSLAMLLAGGAVGALVLRRRRASAQV